MELDLCFENRFHTFLRLGLSCWRPWSLPKQWGRNPCKLKMGISNWTFIDISISGKPCEPNLRSKFCLRITISDLRFGAQSSLIVCQQMQAATITHVIKIKKRLKKGGQQKCCEHNFADALVQKLTAANRVQNVRIGPFSGNSEDWQKHSVLTKLGFLWD